MKIIYGNNIFIFCLRTVETPVPTIERGYSIEILAFTVIFLYAPKYRSPPYVRLLPKSVIYRSLLL